MTDGEKLDQLSRALGKMEGKIDDLIDWNKKREKFCREDMTNVWEAIRQQGDAIAENRTNIKIILSDAFRAGMRGGGVVIGAGGTLGVIVWLLWMIIKIVNGG
ncbi:MAG: hypothetical protein GTN64_00240 [Candidatus Latescibacteria bacterium]|nr:hypothetical protein [Candidatus Latescibacterota bacterium]NIO77048.1 hypothetical protein [Candidatus Latescibacterota bacterium]